MSGEDTELERLKAKRLAEMRQNLSRQNVPSGGGPAQEKPAEGPRETVVRILGFRGLEVLENAEVQFPNETRMIVQKLAELIRSGELAERIDGGQLLSLFRTVGLGVRIATKISIAQDGKLVSLSDKLGSKLGGGGGGD